MPARTGQQYIDGLREQEREVWLGGERVRDVTTHKGLAGGVRAIANLYDMQHDPEIREVMTFASPSTGEPVGRSFDMPKTKEALETRSKMMLNWARATCGMMGRSPDFMNVTFAAWGAAADFFGEKRPEFADNMRRYVEYIREHDVTLTHALINLQRSRNPTGMFNLEEGTALEVKRETDAGIIVRGARILATLGPLSDEIAVYSPRLARHSEEHSQMRIWARPPLLDDADAGQGASAAHRGAHRRVDALYRADALLHAGGRSRCRDRPLGCHVPGDPAGRKHPQSDDELLSAHDRDPAAPGLVELPVDPEREGFRRPAASLDRAVSRDRQHRGPRAGEALPPGLGRRRQRLWQPPGPL